MDSPTADRDRKRSIRTRHSLAIRATIACARSETAVRRAAAKYAGEKDRSPPRLHPRHR